MSLPTECEVCGTPLLNPHALIPLCAECRLVARNERMAAIEAELEAQREQRRAIIRERLALLDGCRQRAPYSRPAPRTDEKPANGG